MGNDSEKVEREMELEVIDEGIDDADGIMGCCTVGFGRF
ncbi:putative radical SAM-modified peptide [Geobacter sp. DSM 9736]|nr:putative radical SAM-modified peptide [Geobacter sp. DSM 9736]